MQVESRSWAMHPVFDESWLCAKGCRRFFADVNPFDLTAQRGRHYYHFTEKETSWEGTMTLKLQSQDLNPGWVTPECFTRPVWVPAISVLDGEAWATLGNGFLTQPVDKCLSARHRHKGNIDDLSNLYHHSVSCSVTTLMAPKWQNYFPKFDKNARVL